MSGSALSMKASALAVVAILMASFQTSSGAAAPVYMNPSDCKVLTSWAPFAAYAGWTCGPKLACPTKGVHCTPDGRVKSVIARNGGLQGTLPANWGSLAAVEELRLGNNMTVGNQNTLSGSLPAAWGSLKKLRVLHLEYNELTGTLPEEWSTMTSLGFLYLAGNDITGTIPGAWRDLQKLSGFDTQGTRLCGPNPTSSSIALPTCDDVTSASSASSTSGTVSTRSTPTPAQQANHGQGSFAKSTGLSKGAAIGIALGCAAGLALICFAVYILMNRRKAKKQAAAGLPIVTKEVDLASKPAKEPAPALPVPKFVPKRGSSKRATDGMDTVSLRDSNEHSATQPSA